MHLSTLLDSTSLKRMAFIYTTLTLFFCSNSIFIFPSTSDFKTFYGYIGENLEKNEMSQKLNFSEGSWYYLKDEELLEFHSNTTGYLDFNPDIQRFYKALYLNAPNRVLVFPKNEDGNQDRRPYVDCSRIVDADDENVIEIYKKDGGIELKEAFKSNSDLNEELELISDELVNTLIKQWNRLPYVNPQITGDISLNSFNNHWAYFENFGSLISTLMFEQNDKYNDMKNNVDSAMWQSFISQSLVRVMRAMYFDDMELLTYKNMTDEEFAFTIAFEPNKLGAFAKIKENDQGLDRLKEYGEAMSTLFFPLTDQMIPLYLESEIKAYLDYYFDVGGLYLSNLLYINNHRQSQKVTFPVHKRDLEFNKQLYSFILEKIQESDGKDDPKSQQFEAIKILLLETKDKFIDLFKKTIDEFYPILSAYMLDTNKETKPQLRYTSLFSHTLTEYKNLETICKNIQKNLPDSYIKYSFDKDEDIKKRFSEFLESRAEELFEDVFTREVLNLVWVMYEFRSWESGLKEEKMWTALGMNPYEERSFEDDRFTMKWMRSLLVLVGEMDYHQERDEEFFDLQKVDLFNFEKKLILI